jgi:hypothetical protein
MWRNVSIVMIYTTNLTQGCLRGGRGCIRHACGSHVGI